jgi:hypothetical protein
MRASMGALDVQTFLQEARVAYVIVALVWLASLLWIKRPLWLLTGALGANAFLWLETMLPLGRLYALGPSLDRISNLGLCQVVAAAGRPLQTSQAGQLHFEPLWGALVALLSLGDPDRLLALYDWLSLLMAAGFVLAVYIGLRPAGATAGALDEDDGPGSAWERVFAAAGATLLCTAPFDFGGTYRAPWAMTFLLKPNHALGLVLFPLVLRAFAGIRGWGRRLAVGLLLHLLGWVFVIHMAYVCGGLVLFALVSWWRAHPDARRDVTDTAVVIGVNVLVMSPYLAILLWGYPIFQPGPTMAIPLWSAHLLEPTAGAGIVFTLGLWGFVVLSRRDSRLARVLTAQVAAAFLLWMAYLALSRVNLAKERDELFHWQRFLLGLLAGIGAWDLGARAARASQTLLQPARRAAVLGLVLLPLTVPYWWDPLRMDSYFPSSLEPLPDRVRLPTDYIRQTLSRDAVFAGDRDYARWIAALGARRSLLSENLHMPKDYAARVKLESALVRGEADAASVARARGVTHLVATPALFNIYPEVSLPQLRTRRDLREVHFTGDPAGDYVALFEIGTP